MLKKTPEWLKQICSQVVEENMERRMALRTALAGGICAIKGPASSTSAFISWLAKIAPGMTVVEALGVVATCPQLMENPSIKDEIAGLERTFNLDGIRAALELTV